MLRLWALCVVLWRLWRVAFKWVLKGRKGKKEKESPSG
jgi:hypothetical protein